MTILGVETSCDDTGIALITESDCKILADFVSSQEKLHSEYGGVFPALAKREHQKNILPIFIKALKKAKMLEKISTTDKIDAKKINKVKTILERNPELFEQIKPFFEKYRKPPIDRICVTVGPGLEPCLYVGINFAKALGFYWGIEINIVHHLEGHILANFVGQSSSITFPAVGLIVSGGNTQIILIEKIGKYKIIGETRDDAAGECFDKTARLLGLGYPGGKKISELASKSTHSKFGIVLPRPMIHEKNLDFSFSGLKTAVLYETKKRDEKTLKSEEYKMEISKEIENAIIDVLTVKLDKAIEKYGAQSILIGGGVSANKKLRKGIKLLAKKRNIGFSFPKAKYSADNAVMIAITPILSPNYKKVAWNRLKPNAHLKINGL